VRVESWCQEFCGGFGVRGWTLGGKGLGVGICEGG